MAWSDRSWEICLWRCCHCHLLAGRELLYLIMCCKVIFPNNRTSLKRIILEVNKSFFVKIWERFAVFCRRKFIIYIHKVYLFLSEKAKSTTVEVIKWISWRLGLIFYKFFYYLFILWTNKKSWFFTAVPFLIKFQLRSHLQGQLQMLGVQVNAWCNFLKHLPS